MDITKNWGVGVIALLALVLAFPSLCHAHALHPAYYALGPYSFLFPFEAPAGLLPIVAVIGIHAIILRVTVSSMTAMQNLWRAGVAFVASKAAESIPGVAVLSTAPWVMWSDDSFGATVLTPLLLFGMGVAVNALVIWAVYRAERRSSARILGAACLLSATSYALLLLSTLGMLRIGWMC